MATDLQYEDDFKGGSRAWSPAQWIPLGRLYEEATGRSVDLNDLNAVLDAVYGLLTKRFGWTIDTVQGLRPEQIKWHLKQLTSDRGKPPRLEAWPPDDGWHFRTGAFAVAGRVYELPGKRLELLEVLECSRLPISLGEMRSKIWMETEPEDQSIRSTISQLRKFLLSKLPFEPDDDPIPRTKHDGQNAWKLDKTLLESRLSAEEKQR